MLYEVITRRPPALLELGQGLRPVLLHLAQEVLLEGDLGQVHPLAFLEPVHVAGRNLGQGYKGGAGISYNFV